MRRSVLQKTVPSVLSIAGSDSGGGAGVQADLKTFAALGTHGTTAITCITAQNPAGVMGIQAIKSSMVTLQLEAVFAQLKPSAVKTGMLFSASIINAVVECLQAHRGIPLVVDPVLVATSGAPLMETSAFKVLRKRLLPMATVITPNTDEAEWLLGFRIHTRDHLRHAGMELHSMFGCAILMKGGHLAAARAKCGGESTRAEQGALDFFFDGRTETWLEAPFVSNVSTHGTGCVLSAAIAAHLARGMTLTKAVVESKKVVSRAIARGVLCRSHDVLWPF